MSQPFPLADSTSFPIDYLRQRWLDALETCREQLDEDDFQEISECDSWEKLTTSLRHECTKNIDQPTARIFRTIEPALRPFRNLSVAVLTIRGNFVQSGLLFGLFNLAITLSISYTKLFPRIVEAIEELSDDLRHNFELVGMYQSHTDLGGYMEEGILCIFVELIFFASELIPFLRRHPLETYALEAWHPVMTDKLVRTSDKIRKMTQRMTEKAHVLTTISARSKSEVVRESVRPKISSITARLPCHMIPYPENHQYVPRTKVVKILEDYLDHDADVIGERSVAIWGTGGIGKTQVALRYAISRKKKVPAIFWVSSEKVITIAQSFTNIATRLGLEGASRDGDHGMNQYLVQQWLENTDSNWLIVFDNVDDINTLRDYLVFSPHGSILITSRCELFSPGIKSIEIPFLDDDEGAAFLLHITNQRNPSKIEKESAVHLSSLLGGLPLALTLMAVQIQRRHMNVSTFLPYYRKNSKHLRTDHRRTLEPYYKHGLDTTWRLSFEAVENESADAATLLQIVSFLGSDDIPLALFQSLPPDRAPAELEFCVDSWSFSEAVESLLRNSIAQKSADTDVLFVHRLIQTEYRLREDRERLLNTFVMCSRLLFEAFPRLGDRDNLHGDWNACRLYVNHVTSFIAHYKDFDIELGDGDLLEFSDCLRSCAWYMFENGLWAQSWNILQIGLDLPSDKQSLLHADFLNFSGIIAGTRNQTREAKRRFQACLEIRSAKLSQDHEHLANAYNNLANELFAEGSLALAMEYYSKAVNIDTQMTTPGPFSFCRYLNMACLDGAQKNFDLAWKHVEQARLTAERANETSGYESMSKFYIGDILYNQGSLEDAKNWYEESLKLTAANIPFHPVIGTILYRIGCVDLQLGRLDSALKFLDKARMMAEYNESTQGDKGDIGRVCYSLAVVHRAKGDSGKADDLLSKAVQIRKDIQKFNFSRWPDSEETYNSLVSKYLYYFR